MSVSSPIRTTKTSSHPYIDTPDFSYDGWLRYLDCYDRPIGKVEGHPRVAVIGAGASGTCAAYELARAGCKVTVFEAADKPGGRCASVPFTKGKPDLAELGAMRFPPSGFTMDYYLQKFGLVCDGGLADLPDFPDPGVVPTYVCYGKEVSIWLAKERRAPQGFETVYEGWQAFNTNGITKKQHVEFQSPQTITQMLRKGDVERASCYWQKYLTAFSKSSFYSFLFDLFTGQSGYDIPGNQTWTFDDFDRFGALGIGSGGFGPLYPIGFTDIFRLLPNGLLATQKFLKKGIRTLPEAFATQLGEQITFHYQTPIRKIQYGMDRLFELYSCNACYDKFDRVVVATTTRSMEMTTNLTETSFLADDVARAVRRTHVVSSLKIAARIRRFWGKNNPNDKTVRCLLTDDTMRQVYTLDYDADDTAVCFLSYTWDDDAVKQQALGVSSSGGAVDKKALYNILLDKLRQNGDDIARWADKLEPYGDPETAIQFVEWQSGPYFNGAFKLSQPGQDPYVHAMFYDFQKAGKCRDTGLYLAGDCIAWTSGWVEGALQTGLNAAAGVIKSLNGKVYGDANDKTPLSIDSTRFDYSGTRSQPVAACPKP